MPLTAGTKLGPYEISGVLGAGGMGEVYRARDTRLERSVAIKVLPPGLTGNAERRTRFEREARTLASLSHPRICTLFDVGEHDGSTFLVMEHLTGETLADRLERGTLPLAQALEIAVQIAEGLDAAHKRGIVHRDLKPSNVMLTKSGAVLLDFGLAKLRAHGETPALTLAGNAPTQSASITREGAILGTLQYMAPEQIQGKEADARADLWALGAMLYEMAAGRRPFTGESAASLMGAILERNPPSLSMALPVSPPSLDRVLRRCLAKNPDERWESARDLADELRWIAQDIAQGETQAAAAAPRPLWRRALPPITLSLAGLAVGLAVTSIVRSAAAPAPRPVIHTLLEVEPAHEVLSASQTQFSFSWTPDSRALVFAGQNGDTEQLFVRPLEGGAARPLAGTVGAELPVISADGKWVAFWSDLAIRKVPLAGGPAPVVVEQVYKPGGMDWGASGLLVFSGIGQPGVLSTTQPVTTIWGVRPGGKPEAMTALAEGELAHDTPHLLPGDRVLLFTVRRTERTWGGEEVVAQVLASGSRKLLLRDAADARYLPSGHLLFMRRGTLVAVPFDADRLELKGEPVAMLDGVEVAVSPAGDLAYIASPPVRIAESKLVTVDRAGRVEPLPAPARGYEWRVDRSPDGRRLAVSIGSTTELGIWIYDLARKTLTQLTPSGGEFRRPLWTPDGSRVAFRSLKSGVPSLSWQRVDGSTPPELLIREAVAPSSWSPDGRELAVVKGDEIWVLDLKVDPPQLRPVVQWPTIKLAGTAWNPAFSPDGHWLLFAGGYEVDQVYIQPYPGPGPRLQVSIGHGGSPAWNPNGREIFFTDCSGPVACRMMAVSVSLGSTATLGTPRELFKYDWEELRFSGTPVNPYSVAPDGQRFFTIQAVKTDPTPPMTEIHLVQNWIAELQAKVPSGL